MYGVWYSAVSDAFPGAIFLTVVQQQLISFQPAQSVTQWRGVTATAELL